MLQLFFAVAFSAAPLTLYVPPVRSLNLFVEAVQGFARQTVDHSARVYPRARLGISRILAALRLGGMRARGSSSIFLLSTLMSSLDVRGHTIFNAEGKKFALHLVPSGILNEQIFCAIGNGVVVHFPGLFKEIDSLEGNGVSCEGRILVSDQAHLLFDFHQQVDGLREAELAKSFIRTTRRGIGPCHSSKIIQNGIRVCDLRHMDKFGQELEEILLMDTASRFEEFKYGADMLRRRRLKDTKNLRSGWNPTSRTQSMS